MASRRLAAPLLIATIAISAACGGGATKPDLQSLDTPGARFNDGVIQVRLLGDGFSQRVVADTTSPSGATLQNPRVYFGSQFITSSYFISEGELRVVFDTNDLPIGNLPVTVENPDGSSDTLTPAFRLTGPPVAVAFGSGQESPPGTSNDVAISYVTVDSAGNSASSAADYTFVVVVSTATAVVDPSPVLVAAGTSAGSVNVLWNRVGMVNISASGFGTATLGSAHFIAGPAARLRVVGATRVGAGIMNGAIVVEDVDGNSVPSPADINPGVVLQEAGGACGAVASCPGGANVNGGSAVVITMGQTSAPFSVECTQPPAPAICAPVLMVNNVPAGWAGLGTGGTFTWTN